MRLITKATTSFLLVLPLLLQGTPPATTSASLVAGTGTGLKGAYFSNANLTGSVALVRTDATLNFQWSSGAPAAGLSADNFSVRWTGEVEAPASGAYTFYTRSDDGVRLWVNKQLLINHWTDHSSYFDQAVPITLAAGQKYEIQVEFYEDHGSALLQLYWTFPGQVTEQIIPQSRLYAGDFTIQAAPPVYSRVWLSDVPWIAATNGDGPPQLDGSNGGSGNNDSKPITINGHRYYSGVGVHARSEIKYALDDQYDMFRAVIGVDDEVGDKGAVTFEVWLDGQRKFQSPVMRGNMPGLAIAIPLENAREMKLIVTSAAADTASDHADWAEARFEGIEHVRYLSDMNWISSANGLGPVERDRGNGGAPEGDGNRISLLGQTYRKGLGTNAFSQIKYALGRRYELFSSIIGIDDHTPGLGSAIFEVWNGTTRLYVSPVMHRGDPVQHIVLAVSAVDELTLKVLDAGDGTSNDGADWADAKLLPLGSDFAPPSASTGLDAAAGNGKIVLTWNLSPLATSYSIYRGATAGGESITPIASGVTGKTWTNNGLSNGTAYFYKIKSVNPNGISGFSNEDSATPSIVSEPPAEPQNLTAKAGDGTAKLAWTGSNAATSYNIYRGTTINGQAATAVAVNVKTTNFTDTGLTNGVTYFYKVKSVNVSGLSPFSSEASAAPKGNPPLAPTELDANAGNGAVKLTWKASANTLSYNIYRGTTSGGQAANPIATGITAVIFNDVTATNGTTFFYKVKSVNAAGLSGFSNQDSATPLARPAITTGLTAAAGDSSVKLSWTAVAGAVSYSLYRGTHTGGEAATPVGSATGVTYTDSGLTNGTAYFYFVAAVNPAGTGARSDEVSATPHAPLSAPANLTATPGDTQVLLSWTAVTNALSYNVYRGTAAGAESTVPVATGVTTTTYVNNSGLTNGVKYYFKVAAVGGGATSPPSNEASATSAALTAAPALSSTAAGNAKVVLVWTPVTGAVSYRVFRGSAANGESATPIATNLTALTYSNTGLTNGTAYFYKVAAVNSNNLQSALSNELSATPVAAPGAPTGLLPSAGDKQITLTWTSTPGAVSYNVYAGTAANAEAAAPTATALATPKFLHTGLINGTNYYYKVTAVDAGGESPRSGEVNSSPEGPAPAADPVTVSAFRLVRQASWGPKPGDVDHVKQVGRVAYLDEQFAATPSTYPDALYSMPVEMTQEQLMQNALNGNDQLRQRVAWALHKIWVVSAVEVDNSQAIVNYHRLFLKNAFGNYRTLMADMTLNPAMGRYLNMLNNRSKAITGAPANENYGREVMQLFTLGLNKLNPDGTAMLDAQNRTIATYSEDDVQNLARVFTGWTFGDGNPVSIPNGLASENWTVPMEPVARYHDTDVKTVLGSIFPPGHTAAEDLNQALDLIFNHPNLPPFVCRQLIQMLVNSNPSPAYVASVSAVFINKGSGVRGDLKAVVRALLTHPEAGLGTATAGKLMEPALLVLSQVRTLNAHVVDHPFLTDLSEEMGQKVMYPGSVFSYFSPGYHVRGTSLAGPEFQILTSVTALTRVNYAARLISGGFGADVTFDLTPYTSRASDPAALTDYCSLLFMGGQMSIEQRSEIINAIRVTPATNPTERVRTALYLTLASAQYQADR